ITRFLSWSIDLACISVLTLIIVQLLGMMMVINGDLALGIGILSYFIISIGYPIFTEWRWRGQTLGKRLLYLRVIDSQGLRLQLSQIVVRNVLRFVDVLPFFYLVGGITCFFNGHAQRLGDLAANTVVIRNPRTFQPDLSQILSGKFNSFREYPHL